jgi:hypothetical protein
MIFIFLTFFHTILNFKLEIKSKIKKPKDNLIFLVIFIRTESDRGVD